MKPTPPPNRVPPKPTIGGNTEIKLLSEPRYVTHEERAHFFEGFYYLTRPRKVFCSDGVIRGRNKFIGMYGNRIYYDSAGKKIPNPWLAFVLAPDFQRPEAYDLATLRCEVENRLWDESAADEQRENVIADLEEQLRLIRLAFGENAL